MLVTQVSGVMAKSLITTQQEKANTLIKTEGIAYQAQLKKEYADYVAKNKSHNDQFRVQIIRNNKHVDKLKQALQKDQSNKKLQLNLGIATKKQASLSRTQDMVMSFEEWQEKLDSDYAAYVNIINKSNKDLLAQETKYQKKSPNKKIVFEETTTKLMTQADWLDSGRPRY